MSVLNANDSPVFSARITLPESGRWFARVELSAEEIAEGSPVTLASYDEVLSLAGTVLRGKMVADRYLALLVGGAGQLDQIVPKLAYRSVSAQIVAEGICSAVGEALAPSPALATILPSWSRTVTDARAALDSLSLALGVPWRFDEQGRVLFGDPLYLEADDENAVEIDRDDATGRLLLGVEAPRLLPGTTIRGVKARTVIHSVNDSGCETEVFFGDTERVRGAFKRLARSAAPRVDFFARYEAKVIRQSPVDDSLELVPDDERVAPISDVPIRVPAPGFRVLVAPLSKVLLGWEGGDPQRPFCEAFSRLAGSATRVDVKSPDVRLGDPDLAKTLSIAEKVDANFNGIKSALAGWVVAGGDGGAAGKAALLSAANAFVAVGTTHTKGS